MIIPLMKCWKTIIIEMEKVSFFKYFTMENKNENYKSTTNNCRNLAQMETADDIDRLCITGIVTDVCQHQIFRPGGKSDSGRIYRFITFVTAYGGNIFRNFNAIFGDQYCIECDTGDHRFSDDREKRLPHIRY